MRVKSDIPLRTVPIAKCRSNLVIPRKINYPTSYKLLMNSVRLSTTKLNGTPLIVTLQRK